jgi:glutathione S-transferase
MWPPLQRQCGDNAMTMTLYGHPFSSYTWKALIALYEKDLPFSFAILDGEHPEYGAHLGALSPVGKFPMLDDGGTVHTEASIIIEYLDHAHPDKAPLIAGGPDAALQIRFLDRLFDNYVMGPTQEIVAQHIPFMNAAPDQARIVREKAALDKIYAWLEAHLPEQGWAAGDRFTLADCAAAPSLFYADWVHPISAQHPRLAAYRARLLSRPSIARAVDGARPYRHLFPLGAPDKD